MNLSLIHHIEMRTPLIWVDSEEGYRVTEVVCAAAKRRPVYRMHAFDGLMAWHSERQRWLRCLVPQGEEHAEKPCYDLAVALVWLHGRHDTTQHCILVLDQAHGTAPPNLLFLNELTNEFYAATDTDNFDALGLQIIMISGVDKIPPELAREVIRIPFGLPDTAELEHLAIAIGRGAPGTVNAEQLVHLVRAGQGLTTAEFTRGCLSSLRELGEVNVDYVNTVKVNIIKAGGVLEVRRPSFDISAMGGCDNAKALLARISWLWDNPEEAKALGVQPVRRVLLVGIPGTGKSMYCEATARSLGLDLAIAGVSKALSKWVGESESNMRNAFRQVAAMKPIVMWVDEFGRDMSGSGVANDAGTTDRVHGEFLTGLQELPDDVFLFAAANRIDNLPPEVLRADRFDKVMFIGFPTTPERAEIFAIHLGAHAGDFDLEALAKATNSFTGAEIKHLIKNTRFDIVPVEHRPITTADLLAAAERLKGRVWNNHREQCLAMYERAKSEWDWASSAQERDADYVLGKARPTVPTVPNGPRTVASAFHDTVAGLADQSGLPTV